MRRRRGNGAKKAVQRGASEMNLRHRNGRGALLMDAEANLNTYISQDSQATHYAKLRDCKLYDQSSAEDYCQVYGGEFHRSIIKGQTIVAGSPYVEKSVLWCSEVSGKPSIKRSYLYGNTEVCDSPTIYHAQLCNAIVYGSPAIDGSLNRAVFTGRIHEGVWTRPPKHIELGWCSLTECIDGKIILACRCRSKEYWVDHGAKLAKRWEWSDEQIKITLETIGREF